MRVLPRGVVMGVAWEHYLSSNECEVVPVRSSCGTPLSRTYSWMLKFLQENRREYERKVKEIVEQSWAAEEEQ